MDRACEQTILLDRVIRANPPLGPRALGIVLGLTLLVNLVIAASFVLRGAWPIAPFLGADVALLAWALLGSARAAKREERVTLTQSSLKIARPPGPAITLNPYWVRLEIGERALTLWSHGKAVRLGAFAGPAELASFGQAFRAALQNARR